MSRVLHDPRQGQRWCWRHLCPWYVMSTQSWRAVLPVSGFRWLSNSPYLSLVTGSYLSIQDSRGKGGPQIVLTRSSQVTYLGWVNARWGDLLEAISISETVKYSTSWSYHEMAAFSPSSTPARLHWTVRSRLGSRLTPNDRLMPGPEGGRRPRNYRNLLFSATQRNKQGL